MPSAVWCLIDKICCRGEPVSGFLFHSGTVAFGALPPSGRDVLLPEAAQFLERLANLAAHCGRVNIWSPDHGTRMSRHHLHGGGSPHSDKARIEALIANYQTNHDLCCVAGEFRRWRDLGHDRASVNPQFARRPSCERSKSIAGALRRMTHGTLLKNTGSI